MSDEQSLTVPEDDDGQRLDRWLKKAAPGLPYGLVQKLIRKGAIRIDDKKAKADTRLAKGQVVRIPPVKDTQSQKPKTPRLSDEDARFIKSLIIYDDGEVIALNKPSGLAVQGGTNTRRHVDGMLDALIDKKGVRPRLVHRLDKDTSGVLLLARSSKVAKKLGDMFKGRDIKKIYWALVTPVPAVREGTIRAPLIKAGGPQKEKMTVDDKEGKTAITDYRVVDYALGQAAFVVFWPKTGRTHQIRVHAAVMECPILGDGKYGGQDAFIDGFSHPKTLHLHAQRIVCSHPSKKGKLDIHAPLPKILEKSWKALGFDPSYNEDPFLES